MHARWHRTSATLRASRRWERRFWRSWSSIPDLASVLLIRIVVFPHILPNGQRAEDKRNFRRMRCAQRFLTVHRARELIFIARIPGGGMPDQFLNRAAA